MCKLTTVVLENPEDDGFHVYRYISNGRAVEVWVFENGCEVYTGSRLTGPAEPDLAEGEHRTNHDLLPLCTAQLLALEILGVN